MRNKNDRAKTTSGEFADLLREIEKECVPERLLDLAQQLQAALIAQREAEASDPGNDADRD